MRTSSFLASARLTHAFSSSHAATDARPAAGRTLPLFLGRESRRSYLIGRPGAPPRTTGSSWARTAIHANPHPRDFQESAR
jgi:hypothetical protein